MENVTNNWLKQVLEKSQNHEDTIVESLEPVVKHDGNLSRGFRAKVRIGGKTQPLFIKVGLSLNDSLSFYVTKYDVDITEIKAYNEDLPNLIEFETQHLRESTIAKMIPKVFATGFHVAENERGYFLVMEDLTKTCGKTAKAGEELSFAKMSLHLKHVARLHAVSFCFNNKNGTVYGPEKIYKFLKFLDDPSMIKALEAGFEAVAKDFQQLENAKELVPYIRRLSKNYRQLFLEAMQGDNRFLIYGDLSPLNIMFNEDGTECKIIDWQFTSAGFPFIDFVLMAFTGTSPSNIEGMLDDLYDVYYATFSSACNDFKTKVPFTKGRFIKDCQTKGFFVLLVMSLFFYDDTKEDGTTERLAWMCKNALRHSPELFAPCD